MITKKEVKHIAKLVRLGLNEKEIEKYQGEFSSILNYVEKLKKVNISEIKETNRFFEVKNITREDKISEERLASGGERMKSEKLLDLIPETKKRYLKIKSIL